MCELAGETVMAEKLLLVGAAREMLNGLTRCCPPPSERLWDKLLRSTGIKAILLHDLI